MQPLVGGMLTSELLPNPILLIRPFSSYLIFHALKARVRGAASRNDSHKTSLGTSEIGSRLRPCPPCAHSLRDHSSLLSPLEHIASYKSTFLTLIVILRFRVSILHLDNN